MSLKRHHYQGFYTTRIKWKKSKHDIIYPLEILQTDRLTFNPFHIEDEKLIVDPDRFPPLVENYFGDVKNDVDEEKTKANRSRALRRARKNIRDLVECNDDLDVFLTLTFDKKVVDRYSYDAIVKKLKIWLSNRSQRYGLKYVLVPEYHKGKKYADKPGDYVEGGIHFHGFMNSTALRLTDSGHKDNGGNTVYNVTDFGFGFTTAVKVGKSEVDRQKVSCYILKYVTKDSEKVGGRYYLHGGELATPVYTYSNDLISDDLCSADPYVFSPFPGATVKIYDCRRLSDEEKRDLRWSHSHLKVLPKAESSTVTPEADPTTVTPTAELIPVQASLFPPCVENDFTL